MKNAIFALLILLALSGPASADMFDVAVTAYNNGNYTQALKLLRPLATKGHAGAQFNLGWMYESGQGVTQDYQEALKWYHLAAEKGHAGAQFNLGWMHESGQGITQDYQEALKWYRLAAAQGTAAAQYNLGVMYGKGQGVIQDHVRAHMWFNLAAASGHGKAIKNRDIAANILTAAQIAEAQKLARECEKRKYKNCD